jgi:hypothetical protein
VIRELLAEFPALLLVLHTGPRVFPLDDRIIAAPVASLLELTSSGGTEDGNVGGEPPDRRVVGDHTRPADQQEYPSDELAIEPSQPRAGTLAAAPPPIAPGRSNPLADHDQLAR